MPPAAVGFWQRIRPKRFRDWLIASIALLLGVPVVIGAVAGSLADDIDSMTVETTIAAATTVAVEATTTTTERALTAKQKAAIEGLLASPTPTTVAPLAECQTHALIAASTHELAGETTLELAAALNAYDVTAAQDAYDRLAWIMDGHPDIAAATVRFCEGQWTATERADIEAEFRTVAAGWAELQAVCRADLALLGFDC